MKKLIAYVVLILLLSIQPVHAQPQRVTWKIDGEQREALVFKPTAGAPQDSHPLIFAFHGHGGGMKKFAHTANLQKFWPQAIVVYPQGLNTTSKRDPQGNERGWQRLPGNDGNRDLKFFDAMLASLREHHRIDDKRIYATGFSNGAFFSFLLWSERSDVFAGFAIVAGTVSPSQRLPVAKPVLHISGRHDPLVTPARTEPTLAEERRVDQANGPGQSCGPDCTLFHGAKADVKMDWHSGGHVYPPFAAAMTVEFFKGLQAAAGDGQTH